jgi:hypothetical protein
MRLAAAGAAALCLAIGSPAGCGEQEEEAFTASEMVAELNREGAGVELGERLQSGSADTRTFGLELAETGGEPEDEHAEGGHHHSGGSLTEFPDGDAASRELANCRRSAVASGAIYCFGAANVLIIVGDEVSRPQLSALTDAVLALARD